MLRIVAILRLVLVMAALLSSAATLPLERGSEDLVEAGVHQKELPHLVEELRAGEVPGGLWAGGVPMGHLLVSSE